MPIAGLGTAYIRPLQYGDTLRLYENRERSPRMLAALFRRALPGFGACTPADVRAMHAGLPAVLEYAIVAASGLLQSDREAAGLETDEDDLYEGHEIPEPRAMAPEGGSATEEATATLDDFEESDLIAFLHERGYTWDEIYRLLPAEIDTLREGHARLERRKERERKRRQGESTTETADAFRPDADAPPGTAPNVR